MKWHQKLTTDAHFLFRSVVRKSASEELVERSLFPLLVRPLTDHRPQIFVIAFLPFPGILSLFFLFL